MAVFKKLAAISILILVVALSGCFVDREESEYSNDVIIIEDYAVSTLNPYVNSRTTIEFMVKNNGEHNVPRVTVNFFDISGFIITELRCDGVIQSAGSRICVFDKNSQRGEIEPFDVRSVSAVLQTPSSDIIKTKTTYTVSYYVNYSYSGSRTALIPIIDGTTRKEPLNQFSQSTPSYGPIQVNFEGPVGRTRKEGDVTIKEYWAIKDRPFELKLELEDVGSDSMGTISLVNIKTGDLRMELSDMGKVNYLTCDFCDVIYQCDTLPGGVQICSYVCDDQVYLAPPGADLLSKETITVPDTFKCNFISLVMNQPEVMATISAEFDYTYEYTRTETFEILPIS